MTFNDAMMLLVFLAMAAWIYGMFRFFGPGADDRWCLHSIRHECALCRWCRTREGEPPHVT